MLQIFKMHATRRGELYLAAEIALWSLFPVISLLAVNTVSPLLTAALAMLIAGVVFTALLLWRGEWRVFRSCTVWQPLLASVALIGIFHFGLLFYGLQFTTAGNAAVFLQFEVLFNFLLLGLLLRHEPIIPQQLGGAALMVGGALLILLPNGQLTVNWGDAIIVLSTVVLPFGNRYSQRALKQISPIFLMTVRSWLAGGFLLALSLWLEGNPALPTLRTAWLPIVLTGIFLLGLSKILWLRAISLLPISKCTAIGSPSVVALTMIFAYFLLGEIPTEQQLLGIVPIVVGGWLLTKKVS